MTPVLSVILAYPSAVTQGDLLLVYTHSYNLTASCSDSPMNNIWNPIINYNDGTEFTSIFIATAKSTGATSVTIAHPSGDITVGISQWTCGVPATWMVDAAPVGSRDSTATTQKSTAITTKFPVELAFCTFFPYAQFNGSQSALTAPWLLLDSLGRYAGAQYYLPTTVQSGLQASLADTGPTNFVITSLVPLTGNQRTLMGVGQ